MPTLCSPPARPAAPAGLVSTPLGPSSTATRSTYTSGTLATSEASIHVLQPRTLTGLPASSAGNRQCHPGAGGHPAAGTGQTERGSQCPAAPPAGNPRGATGLTSTATASAAVPAAPTPSWACPAPACPQGGAQPGARVRGGCCSGRSRRGEPGGDHRPQERGRGTPAAPSNPASPRLAPTQEAKRFPHAEEAGPMEIALRFILLLCLHPPWSPAWRGRGAERPQPLC